MSTELESLIRKRASIKSNLTIFNNYVKRIETLLDLEESLSTSKILELENRIAQIRGLFDKFDDIQAQIELIAENFDEQFSEREQFQTKFYENISHAQDILSSQSQDLNNDNIRERSRQNLGQNIQLPTIQLPKFGGAYEGWLEFRDTFESLIHKNKAINDVQKFHYLRASLTGEAADVIGSLEFISGNYMVAWDILCNRYNNTRLLVHNHVKALFNLESITRESSTHIRKTIDTVSKHLRTLNILKQPTSHWDTLIIYLITTKLDIITAREWEQYKPEDVPTLENLKQFLKLRADLLETLEQKQADRKLQNPKEKYQSKSNAFLIKKPSCGFCQKEHYIQNCADFLKLSPEDRVGQARKAKLCTNCLRRGHFSKDCRSGTCQRCNGKHHTILHYERDKVQEPQSSTEGNEKSVSYSSQSINQNLPVLLSTASVQIFDKNLRSITARALLDAGSQSNFITTRLCDKLQLPKERVVINVGGLNNSKSLVEFKCTAKIQSHHTNYSKTISFLALPEISGYLPNFQINLDSLKIPQHIKLADPSFHEPSEVDLLLGADSFWELICAGQIKLVGPTLQKTKLGWIIAGPINSPQSYVFHCNVSQNVTLENQIAKFWQIEECSIDKLMSKEEKACEKHFSENTYRDDIGRFVVSIPLKDSPDKLGNSRESAVKRFLSLERRLAKNEEMRDRYIKFMRDYESLGHMSKVSEESPVKNTYYMPHHGVLKEDSTTTKLRVVFDASAVTTSGLSLNNIQMVGPTLQQDILAILLRFRKHTYVFSADVEKMYRQVLVRPDQRSLQRIIWRDDPNKALETYELQTVTYGTASAAYLAIRCLFQLGINCEDQFPEISNIIKYDFYVDDLISGANSISQAIENSRKISQILEQGGFKLRKWVANNQGIVEAVADPDDCTTPKDLCESKNAKTLGLIWGSHSDLLMYVINQNISQRVNKRVILSDIAQIFDPLGLLAPCIIQAKIFMQRLWQEKVSWDESLPLDMHTSWIDYRKDLMYLNNLRINRRVVCENCINLQIHGFSDSSIKAYGATIYIRSQNSNGQIFVNLLCAKSKVAPLKTISIPRLELCAALILAKLVCKVKDSLNMRIDSFTFWSDSTIVLGWLKMSPNLLQTFVGNRVSQIQELTDIECWRHVPTAENPADYLSRGVNPKRLRDLSIWWNGPPWLSQDKMNWPILQNCEENLPELRNTLQSHTAILEFDPMFKRYSSLTKLQRVTAFCLRFKQNCLKARNERNFGPLTANELNISLDRLARLAQTESFPDELKALNANKLVSSKSRIVNLTPFLDNEGTIRVGGRLRNSQFEFRKKHPVVLLSKHPLTKLIFISEHNRLLHAGPQMLLASIRERFWPILGRNLAKKVVHECVVCFRAKPRVSNAIMGNLPRNRVSPSPPFHSTGVDYAGPLLIKDRKGRGCKVTKCYIALFICFCTRAIHLELVSDLSTEAFLASFRRFIARRGKPSIIYSDNGTNFVGASSELDRLGNFLLSNSTELTEKIHNTGITWKFIPAYSPHFGGLWEAGVKSMKHHLRRVAGNAILTFEALNTLLVQIEAVLNSRPLSAISCDPNDFSPLTPAHFLIGRSMLTIADENFMDIPKTRLSYFESIQQLTQHFWARWSKECIAEMQQKIKWTKSYASLEIGCLVLIKDDNQPPLKWKLGRIVELHAGQDGVARVASIKTLQGVVKRAYTKICPLPCHDIQ